MNAAEIAEYVAELAALKASTLATCRELVHDLEKRPLDALRVDEAQLYLRAAFTSLERTLAGLRRQP